MGLIIEILVVEDNNNNNNPNPILIIIQDQCVRFWGIYVQNTAEIEYNNIHSYVSIIV